MTLTEARATESAEAKWDGLRPRNVVQAAQADIERRRRNEKRANPEYTWKPEERYEQYAFMRDHVKAADGAFGLIQTAVDAITDKDRYDGVMDRARNSTKRHMKHLYSEPLLRAALELEKHHVR